MQPAVMTNQKVLSGAGSRELSWDGCVNARDLGGLGRARPGTLVRMEAPARLTAAGWAAAWAYEVRTVVDLRDPGEVRSAPDRAPRPLGITAVPVPHLVTDHHRDGRCKLRRAAVTTRCGRPR